MVALPKDVVRVNDNTFRCNVKGVRLRVSNLVQRLSRTPEDLAKEFNYARMRKISELKQDIVALEELRFEV